MMLSFPMVNRLGFHTSQSRFPPSSFQPSLLHCCPNSSRITMRGITPTQIEYFKYSIQQLTTQKLILIIENPNNIIKNHRIQYQHLIQAAKSVKSNISLVHIGKIEESKLQTHGSNKKSVVEHFSGKHFHGFGLEAEHTVKGLLNNKEKLYNDKAHLLTAFGKAITESDARYMSSIQNPICIELSDSEDIENITEQVELINPDNNPDKIILSTPSIIQGPIEFMTRKIEDMERLFQKLQNREISWVLNPFTDLPDQFQGNDYKRLNEDIIKDTIDKAKKAEIRFGGFFVKVLPHEGNNICLLHKEEEEGEDGRKRRELIGLDLKDTGRRNIGMDEVQTSKIMSEIGRFI